MIRRAAAVLLAANLAFWAWTHWFREQRVVLPVTVPTPAATATPESPSAPTIDTDAPPPAAVDDLPQDCVRLSGFSSQASLDAAAARLAVGNLVVTSSAATGRDGTAQGAVQVEAHWVQVAGLRDANAQRELLDRLRSAGLSDAYAVPDDAEHRVSVGLFSDADRARKRVEQLRVLGVDATVVPRMRGNPPQRWLEIRGSLPADITTQVIQGWGLDPAEVSLSPCQP